MDSFIPTKCDNTTIFPPGSALALAEAFIKKTFDNAEVFRGPTEMAMVTTPIDGKVTHAILTESGGGKIGIFRICTGPATPFISIGQSYLIGDFSPGDDEPELVVTYPWVGTLGLTRRVPERS